MKEEEYIKKLEKLIEDQEQLIDAQNVTLRNCLDFARDREEEIKHLGEFFHDTIPIVKSLCSLIKAFSEDDLKTPAKFKELFGENFQILVEALPSETATLNAQAHWHSIKNTYESFDDLVSHLESIQSRLAGESKFLVDSCLESIRIAKENKSPYGGHYGIHF